MRYLIAVFVFFVLQFGRSFAQNSYTILFKTYYVSSDSILVAGGNDMLVAIKDSLSYTYYAPLEVKYPLGSSFMPKSTFVNINSRLIISPYGYLGEPKTYALLVDKFPETKWNITNERKIILGDTCIKAVGILHGVETIVFYSPKLPVGFGFFTTLGLPGTILEAYIPERKQLTTAENIIKSSPDICEPVYSRKVLKETYIKKRTMSLDPKIRWKKKDFID